MIKIEDIKKALNKGDKKETSFENFASIDYTIPSIPLLIEKKNEEWVNYGEDNLYPLAINDLRTGSGIHNSIIKTKTKMTAGDGFLVNGKKTKEESDVIVNSLPANIKAEYNLFLKNIDDVIYKCADDLQEQGQFCVEVVWDKEHTKIISKKHIDVKDIRSGKIVNGKVQSYWYSRDWKNFRKKEFTPVEIKAFNQLDKSSNNQLIFEKIGNNDYYGQIPYSGGLTWIQIDMKMALFHLSNLDNGMNPGLHFRFFTKPKSEEEKQRFINDVKKHYQGSLRVGNPFFTFSNGKDDAMEIKPIEISQLDKQLVHMAELCDKKILTAHQLTTPMLAGLTTSGQLGGSTELEVGYNIFDKMTIKSDRNFLIKPFNEILKINKVPLTLEINPFNPFA